jgi:hypothetical protein
MRPTPPKPPDCFVMAVLLLIITIIRYWRYIPWSAR